MARQTLTRRTLSVEHLEPRHLLSALTVITHGLQPKDSEDPEDPDAISPTNEIDPAEQFPPWIVAKASAIDKEANYGCSPDEIKASVMKYDLEDLTPPADGCDSLLLFDWAEVSRQPGIANSSEVAGALTDMIRERLKALPAGDRMNLHVIGHSRGSFVISSVVHRLATDLDKIGFFQMTTLDPQSHFPPPALLNDGKLKVPTYIDFAENYYQQTGGLLEPGGQSVPGANPDINLTDPLKEWTGRTDEIAGFINPPDKLGWKAPEHQEVHDWYHWTIDTDDTSIDTLSDPILMRQELTLYIENRNKDEKTRDLLYRQEDGRDSDGDGIADEWGYAIAIREREENEIKQLPISDPVLPFEPIRPIDIPTDPPIQNDPVDETTVGPISQLITAAAFQGLDFTYASAVSADGSVVVGINTTPDQANNPYNTGPGMVGHGVLWTTTDGAQQLREPRQCCGISVFSRSNGISDDGSVVVGSVFGHGTTEAHIWTSPRVRQSIGFLPGQRSSGAADVSADGSIIVGENGHHIPYWWSERTGMKRLPLLPNHRGATPYAISSDGSVIVGTSIDVGYTKHAVIWKTRNSVQDLGKLPGRNQYAYHSIAYDVSADGSVVVGSSDDEAFIWTDQTGMQILGKLPGKTASEATAISSDGSIVVGTSWSGSDYSRDSSAFLWTKDLGMRSVSDIFNRDNEFDLSGWKLLNVTDVSPDGLTLVGAGINPDGRYEAWIARIDHSSPESGDANLDNQFDQLDIVFALQGGKFLTGQPAVWNEGDWNNDNLFNQLDIVAALQTGNYLAGP